MSNRKGNARRYVMPGAVFMSAASILFIAMSCSRGDKLRSDTGSDSESEEPDTGEIGDGDRFISGVEVSVHRRVKTILEVSWTQDESADDVWVAFTFENDEWFASYPKKARVGAHQEVVLGIPQRTEVTLHIVSKTGNSEAWSSGYVGTTGAVPNAMPRPTVENYDRTIASANRWLFGSVNDTPDADESYYGPFWLYIIDRKGRIVWYYADLGDNPVIGFPRISRDGRYIYFGNRRPWEDSGGFQPSVVKMTLDWEYFEEIELDMWDNVDMTRSGSLVFNTNPWGDGESWLVEYSTLGMLRPIWNCTEVFRDECYSNTINWNAIDDSVFLAFPYMNTAVEIDRTTGDMVATYGELRGSYDFDPPSWTLGFPHYAHMTDHGTFMVSSRMPGGDDTHGFLEFDVDRENEVITERWYYDEGPEWAHNMGEAHYVGNGSDNVLANYGTAGVIREITQDKRTAWYVKFDAPWEDDTYNKMVGHCTLTNDLYALNRGM